MTSAAYGAAASSSVVVWAVLRGSLTPGAGVAAVAIGTACWWGTGPEGWVLLIGFFLTSTALGRLRHSEKQAIADRIEGDSRRRVSQVLANGLVPAIVAVAAWREAICRPRVAPPAVTAEAAWRIGQ